jgi:hypothetical protein
MKFVTSNKIQSVEMNGSVGTQLFVKGGRKTALPSEHTYSGVIYGRIKGTGLSLKGIEMQTLVTTPTEVIVFGAAGNVVWRKPLNGLQASNQALDAVKLTAKDKDSINFVVGMPIRSRMIRHLTDASTYALGVVTGAVILDQVSGEFIGNGTGSHSRDEIDPEHIRDLVEEVGENFVDGEEENEEQEADYSYDDGGDFDF